MISKLSLYLCLTTAAITEAASPMDVSKPTGNRLIYPEGHWTYSTELDESNVDDFVQNAIDQGKTAYIRWVASRG